MAARWIILALALGIAVALLIQLPGEPANAPPQAAPEGAATTPAPDRTGPPDDAAVPSYQPHEFRNSIRSFVDQAARLSAARRRTRAAALRSEILEREEEGLLLPGESAYLQLALLRVTVEDEGRLRERSSSLLAEYQQKLDARWEKYRRKPDVRHEAYRAEEAELVRRAMTDGAGALSQDELRRRLQTLRERYYGDEPLQ